MRQFAALVLYTMILFYISSRDLNIVFIKFFDSICLFQTLKSDTNVLHRRTVLSQVFLTLSFDDVTVDDVTVARDM